MNSINGDVMSSMHFRETENKRHVDEWKVLLGEIDSSRNSVEEGRIYTIKS